MTWQLRRATLATVAKVRASTLLKLTLRILPVTVSYLSVSKQKDVGGRPVHKAEFDQGPMAAQKFEDAMRRIVATPKKDIQGRKGK